LKLAAVCGVCGAIYLLAFCYDLSCLLSVLKLGAMMLGFGGGMWGVAIGSDVREFVDKRFLVQGDLKDVAWRVEANPLRFAMLYLAVGSVITVFVYLSMFDLEANVFVLDKCRE
jgi:hypothetical protein